VLKNAWLAELREAEERSLYSLEFRVSIDGFSPQTNDPIRGEGTFDRAMRGVLKLVEFGFLPIITAARTWELERESEIVGAFVAMLREAGYSRPRLKILPTLHIGAEEQRTHGYRPTERVTAEMLESYDRTQLVCEHSRIVTDRGVHVCPILIESPDSLLGQTLADSLRPYAIVHGACSTCYQYGALCSNPSSGAFSSQPPPHP
jgi:MoaA/NifB/PqqE/SkfB family radical SAM enzyme